MVLLLWLVVGTISMFYVRSAIMQHSAASMNFLIQQKAEALDAVFSAAETDVEILKDFIEDVDGTGGDFYGELKKNALFVLSDQPHGIKTVFFYPDRKEDSPTECVYLINVLESQSQFRQKVSGYSIGQGGNFMDCSFDISDGSKDTSLLGEAKRNSFAHWTGVYQNNNIETAITSFAYVSPVFRDGEFFGAVGVEVSTLSVRAIIDNLGYGSSFAFLAGKDGELVYHRDFLKGLSAGDFSRRGELETLKNSISSQPSAWEKPIAYKWNGEKHNLVLRTLRNGMVLALSAPEKQLFSVQEQMIFQMSLLIVISLTLAFFVISSMTDKIVKPIENITAASVAIAHGELHTKIDVESDDEIGILASSIKKIEVELSEYIDKIRDMAYCDKMTGCRNKSAYLMRQAEIERRMEEGLAEFTVYVFDVNGLKRINDTKGHEMGDLLIKSAANALKLTFNEKSIFRTGGDEFVVVLDDKSQSGEEVSKTLAAFEAAVAECSDEAAMGFPLAVSAGAAVYDRESDREFKSTLERADKAMYENKEAFYKKHEEMRRK